MEWLQCMLLATLTMKYLQFAFFPLLSTQPPHRCEYIKTYCEELLKKKAALESIHSVHLCKCRQNGKLILPV